MKYAITVDGTHAAVADISPDGKGGFTGTIASAEFGTCQITNGKQDGDNLSGGLTMEGYNCTFKAIVSGPLISGTVGNWLMRQPFAGREIQDGV